MAVTVTDMITDTDASEPPVTRPWPPAAGGHGHGAELSASDSASHQRLPGRWLTVTGRLVQYRYAASTTSST